MSGCNEVTVDKAKALLTERSMLVLDKRDRQSYHQQGRLDGAMLAHDALIETLIGRREIDKPILVYCYRGNDSKDHANMFTGLGFKEVYSMVGGYVEWKRYYA